MKNIVVAITGATGIQIAFQVVKTLSEMDVKVHLVVSKWGRATLEYETQYTLNDFTRYAFKVYNFKDQFAGIASGSFSTDGMVVVPCSMKTLASIRLGLSDNLIVRAADVTLKEKRKLILVPREMPLNSIHLEHMLALSKMDVCLCPPVLTFYDKPQSIDDMVLQCAYRIIEQLGIEHPNIFRWQSVEDKK